MSSAAPTLRGLPRRDNYPDTRRFFNLLRLFFAAMAVLDCIMWMLHAHARLFAALRFGIKDTWLNVFSCIDEVLGRLPCVFAALVEGSSEVPGFT